MLDGLHALGGSIAEEIHGMLIKPLLVGAGIDDIGLYAADGAQGTVIDGRIHLHAACVEHGAQQGVILQLLAEEYGHGKQFQGWNSNQAQVLSVADAFGHRDTDAQTRIGTWSAAHGNGIKGYGMAVGKGHGLIDESAQPFRMVGSAEVLIMVDAGSILAHSHGTGVSAGFNMQYTGHLARNLNDFLIIKCKITDFSSEICIFA